MPATDGDLMPMAEQVRRAVAWVYRNAASFGGDPERISFPAPPRAVTSPASCELLVGDGYNHFEIQRTFANPYALLGRAVLEQMELTRC